MKESSCRTAQGGGIFEVAIIKSVHGICAQQRARHDMMVVKQKALHGVLKRIQITSKSAILLLKDLQCMQEECLSVGHVVCSKVQHSVTECDPGSPAVAGSVAAIGLATVSVARAGNEVEKVCKLITAIQGSFDDATAQQKEAQDDLCAMCNVHSCATDVHALALNALETGLGHEPGSGLQCASCMGDAQAVYAARTGMCRTCHEKAVADAMDSGWERCVKMEDAI